MKIQIICPNCKNKEEQEIDNYEYNSDIQNYYVGCEDCGEHPAWRCSNCEEIYDLVMSYEEIEINKK